MHEDDEADLMHKYESANFTYENKAGYTATSCGRVGRGGNMRFHTFQLDHYQRTNGRMDKASYGVASPRLKIILLSLSQGAQEGAISAVILWNEMKWNEMKWIYISPNMWGGNDDLQ